MERLPFYDDKWHHDTNMENNHYDGCNFAARRDPVNW